MAKKTRIPVDSKDSPTGQPLLRELLEAQGVVLHESGSARPERDEEKTSPFRASADWSTVERVVLQFERKGHGGRKATRVEGLPFGSETMEGIVRELRSEMGCGAWIEQGNLLLQGDLVERLKNWFAKKGCKRVVVSGKGVKAS